MEYVSIPNVSNNVSRIGLGCWAIGGSLWGGTNENEAIATIHRALEKGINFIDTAPAYGKGASEKIVGKALKEYGKRDQIVIATKVGLNQETESVFRDLRRESILKELDDSLRRLGVDYIDLYQIHWPDPHTHISETATVLGELLKQGKIRAIGVCNYSVEQMDIFRSITPLHTSQFPFNVFESDAEKEIIPFCLREEIGMIGYSALCRGLLSGKMTKDRQFNGDDLRKGMDPKFQEPYISQYVDCANALQEWVQEKYKKSLIELAIRWVLDKNVHIALWGARHIAQLNPIDRVFGWKLKQEDYVQIGKIIEKYVPNPIGPEFMAPPERKE